MSAAGSMLPLSKRFRAAVDFALELHADHARKQSGIPYAAHLLSVAALAMEHGADEDVAIAALLHDAVEDRGGLPTLERIRARFGERPARIVLACSDSVADGEDKKAPWRERKERYLEQLKVADADARLVSACDKLHNARSILGDLLSEGPRVFLRFQRDEPTLAGKRASVLWYYRSLVDEFRARGPERLAGELERTVAEIERLSAESHT